MSAPKTFEQAYRHYPFAELVALGIAAASHFARRQAKRRSLAVAAAPATH